MPGTRACVLVVDDDPMIRRLVRAVLEADEFEVIDAPDGASALAIIGETHPAVVVLDVMMPGLSGLEVLEQIDHNETRVVMLTARADPDMEDACRAAGAARFLTKPFSSVELLEVVASLVKT